MSSEPRVLDYYWNYRKSESARALWREFIDAWIKAHGRSSELADLHWLNYVEAFMEYDAFESLSGSKLTRKAESAAQALLANMLASDVKCKFCARLIGD